MVYRAGGKVTSWQQPRAHRGGARAGIDPHDAAHNHPRSIEPDRRHGTDTLNKGRSVRLTALAAAEGIAQPSMTELVHRLERQGLATRVNDPEDGRAALVNITNAGRAMLDDRRRYRRHRLAELLKALSPEEEATLTLAAHVALPIIRRLVHSATNPPHDQTAKPRDQRSHGDGLPASRTSHGDGLPASGTSHAVGR